MQLFNGIHLTGSVKDSHEGDVENGREYEVVSVTADQLRVRLVGQEEASMLSSTQAEAMKKLRLSCARTYAGCQGQTIRDQRVVLLDVDSPHFDRRKCYVAVSRVTSGALLHVATAEQQERWLRGPAARQAA